MKLADSIVLLMHGVRKRCSYKKGMDLAFDQISRITHVPPPLVGPTLVVAGQFKCHFFNNTFVPCLHIFWSYGVGAISGMRRPVIGKSKLHQPLAMTAMIIIVHAGGTGQPYNSGVSKASKVPVYFHLEWTTPSRQYRRVVSADTLQQHSRML